MKKMIIKNIKEELISLNASKSMIDLVLNNVSQYNGLIEKYKSGGNDKLDYLIYILNNQIVKQLQGIRVMALKEQAVKDKSATNEDDFFSKLVKKVETRNG